MKRFLQSVKSKVAVAASALLASVSSYAAVDTTAIVTEIATNETAIVAIGGALLALAVVAVGIKWLKGTIFG